VIHSMTSPRDTINIEPSKITKIIIKITDPPNSLHFQGFAFILEATNSLEVKHPLAQPVFPGSSRALKRLYLYSSFFDLETLVALSLAVLPLKS
jgi:hypothetical protein